MRTIEQIIEDTETWLVTGKLNTDAYQKILTNIVKFDPLIRCVGLDGKHFSIVLRYFTRNGIMDHKVTYTRDTLRAYLNSLFNGIPV